MADTSATQGSVPEQVNMTTTVFQLVQKETLAKMRITSHALGHTVEEIAAAWLDYVAQSHVDGD